MTFNDILFYTLQWHSMHSMLNTEFSPSLPCTGPRWILVPEGGTWTGHSPEAAGQSVGHEEHQQWNQELGALRNGQALSGRGRCFCGPGGLWNVQQLPGHSTETEGSGAAAPQPRLWTTSQGATSRRRPGTPGGYIHTYIQSLLIETWFTENTETFHLT